MTAEAVRERSPARQAHGAELAGTPDVAPCRLPSEQHPATGDAPQLSEAALVQLWAGQRFPASALVTRQGVALRVLHPGRRGRGAGPDFRDALVAAPSGALLRGDVELHARATAFQAHGHQRDARYNGLVLHLVFEDDLGEDTLLASGRRVPVIALASWMGRRAQELGAWLSGPSRWREPCHDALVRLGPEEVLRTLEELGDRRFRQREAALDEAIEAWGPGEALYRALLEGLGYGGDRQRLAPVAEGLPWRELSARLGRVPAPERAVLAEAALLWAAGGADALSAGLPASVRPANRPERRLAGLARLLARHRPVLDGRIVPGELLKGRAARLTAGWSVPALIGRSRAIELLTNAVLPWAAALAERRGEQEEAARARAYFAFLPRPDRYGALAFLEAHLRSAGRPLPLDARRQQGLLALYKTECTQGGCGRCPLS